MRHGSLLGAAMAASLALTQSIPLQGQEGSARGVLHVVWDGESATDPHGRLYFLVDAAGDAVQLVPGVHAETLVSLNRHRVEVRARPAPGTADALRVEAVRSLEATPSLTGLESSSVAKDDFVTLLCRFADDSSTPFTIGEVETVHGPTYPGVRQYYGELSRDADIMAGSVVRGWYTLPNPRSYYVQEQSTSHGALVRDCTAAADAEVDFTDFYGVNVQMNGPLSRRATPPNDVLSFGGSWSLNLDGASRVWGVTWLSSDHFDNYVVVPHEMGHALGWPHSSGRYGEEYDSRWDLMSVGYLRYEEPWGWLSIHTIAHHKRNAGWIPESRLWAPAEGAIETRTIVRSALPPAEGYLMAEVPRAGGGSYTVEARFLAGHDSPLPGEVILIHETEGSRAYVLDPDLNGDPNDEGAMWRVGESFVDPASDLRITIEERLADGYVVTISRAPESTCTLAVSANPVDGGTAAVTEGGLTGPCGRTVTVTATSAEGWAFVNWTAGGEERSTASVYSFTLDTNLELVANFQRQCAVDVSASPVEGGTAAVTEGGLTGPCGRTVTVTATSAESWAFVHWTSGGSEVSTSAQYSFQPTADRQLVAHFEEQCTVEVGASPTMGGSASVAQGGETGSCGRTVRVVATASTGWAFVHWTEGQSSLGGESTLEFTLQSDRSLTANFVSAEELGVRLVESLLAGTGTITSAERAMLDARGNQNGTFDLGDLLAFLDRHPNVGSALRSVLRGGGVP